MSYTRTEYTRVDYVLDPNPSAIEVTAASQAAHREAGRSNVVYEISGDNHVMHFAKPEPPPAPVAAPALLPMWCDSCGTVENFTPEQVEQVVYALAAEAATAAVDADADRLHVGKDWRDAVPCLSGMLALAYSGEGYGELADGWTRARKAGR